jgi:hypothetical protein
MELLLWIGSFAAGSLFWAWILFWGGAERLEGSMLSGFLLWIRAPEWPAEGIKLFAWGSWICQTIGFVIALIL